MSAARVFVAGAGLSGLACALDLARMGADVTVLEAGARAGGVVGTVDVDGFRFEIGPNAIQSASTQFRRLCGDLGIADRLITSSPDARSRFLFLGGRLRELPRSPLAFLFSRLLSARSKLLLASEVLRRWQPPAAGDAEPDFGAFVTERLGAESARTLAGAVARGVYASEMWELGARSAFPGLWRACADHGGIVRGLLASKRQPAHERPSHESPVHERIGHARIGHERKDVGTRRTDLLSFPGGLQELIDAAVRALGGRLRTSAAVEGLERRGTGWRVRSGDATTFDADRLVLAVPAHAAVRLLAPISPLELPLASLRRVDHASLTLVHLGLARSEVPRLPRGLGYLVPPRAKGPRPEDPRAIGTIFLSNLFPGRAPEGCVAVSSFYKSGDLQGLEDPELVAVACEDLSRALGERRVPRPRACLVLRHTEAIPRYAPGHGERMSELEAGVRERLPGIHLAGSYLAGVSVEQVIARGRAIAAEILP